jgi:hypothetical protein
MSSRLLSATAALMLCLAPLALRAEFAAPTGPVLLTASGAITQSNTDGGVALDLAMLQAIGADEVTTTTIWTEGELTFTGVWLSDLAAALGASGQTVRATAINDYQVEIPASDAVPGGAFVAYLMNGAPMSVRDKGPLWIVYPFDDNPDYQSEVVYARSIWQLDRIEFTP